MKKTIDRLYIVLKVTEVCNLDCKYCYFFYGGDDSFKQAPARIETDTLENIGQFLAQGISDLNISVIDISFHGGEPMMIGKSRFKQMCQILHKYVSDKAELRLSMQTNGLLVDEQWIEILSQYKINVGLSLDGPEAVNDKYRTDKHGDGSYDKTVKGLRLLQQAAADGQISAVGIIAVINPQTSPVEIYDHLVYQLGIKTMYFAPPFMDWRNHDLIQSQQISNYYQQLVNHWLSDNNREIKERFLSNTLSALLTDANSDKLANFSQNNALSICIRDNGDLCPDDSLVPISKKFRFTNFNVGTDSLSAFLADDLWQMIDYSADGLADECKKCQWLGVCGGGLFEHRYSVDKAFANKSVYCDARIKVFETLYDYVAQHIEPQVLDNRLQSAAQITRAS